MDNWVRSTYRLRVREDSVVKGVRGTARKTGPSVGSSKRVLRFDVPLTPFTTESSHDRCGEISSLSRPAIEGSSMPTRRI